MNHAQHPLLLVTADSAIGLAVVRSLARWGISVYCARASEDSLGSASRYCRGWFRWPQDEEQAIEALLRHGHQWGVTRLAAVSENHIALLNRWRKELAAHFTLLFPPEEIFQRAAQKHVTLEYARRAGIRTPMTMRPQSLVEAEACRGMPYPVVLKMSHRNLPPGKVMEFGHKSLLVPTYDALVDVLGGLTPGCYPMVQEYVPGQGFGMSMLMRGGRAVLAFQHRRIREYPPGGGVSVYCESTAPDPQLRALSERLLQEMEWDGVAMVEYRGDPASGAYALMEVNGRFWGSLPGAIAAGADFPYWLYRTSFESSGGMPDSGYRTGVRLRSLAGDTKWVYQAVRTGHVNAAAALVQYLGGFRPGTRYFIWDWRDPGPAVMNFLRRFLPL
jgi:predicted ATP-grasp superfamily ATP-dependent carboligase